MANDDDKPGDLPFNVTSVRDRALLISGPLRIKATDALRDFFAEQAERGVELIEDRIEFASFEHAAAGLALAELVGVVNRQQAAELIREAAEELRDSKRAVLIKNLGGEDHDDRTED